jgi:hypothetical protein
MSARDERAAEALEYLREYFKPGDTVYTVLTNVSSSGMTRRMAVLAAITDREGKPGIYNVSHLVARAGLFKMARNHEGEITVSGAGMDMGFHVAYTMGLALYPDTDNRTFGGGTFKDGGYSLNHRWL